MKNNLDLTGAGWSPTQKRGFGRTGALCLGRAPVYVFATLSASLWRIRPRVSNRPRKTLELQRERGKTHQNQVLIFSFLSALRGPHSSRQIVATFYSNHVSQLLTNPANVSSNPKPSRKCPFSKWNRPEPSAKIDAPLVHQIRSAPIPLFRSYRPGKNCFGPIPGPSGRAVTLLAAALGIPIGNQVKTKKNKVKQARTNYAVGPFWGLRTRISGLGRRGALVGDRRQTNSAPTRFNHFLWPRRNLGIAKCNG